MLIIKNRKKKLQRQQLLQQQQCCPVNRCYYGALVFQQLNGETVTEISAEPDTLRAGLQAARAKRPISCKLGCQGQ
ncbi:hypothetical protein T09_12858 [Trichinella sp. T9]|nr:hypothetical protein T09_12858 [Trichinella sp. T9]